MPEASSEERGGAKHHRHEGRARREGTPASCWPLRARHSGNRPSKRCHFVKFQDTRDEDRVLQLSGEEAATTQNRVVRKHESQGDVGLPSSDPEAGTPGEMPSRSEGKCFRNWDPAARYERVD